MGRLVEACEYRTVRYCRKSTYALILFSSLFLAVTLNAQKPHSIPTHHQSVYYRFICTAIQVIIQRAANNSFRKNLFERIIE